jgi:glycosyltransferase involved in cell wall biosynthesis
MAVRVPSDSVPAREASLCSGNLQSPVGGEDYVQIAQIAPLTEAIPPKLYGGTERVISWLADELVALGHQVVLFASGDSQTSANLEACWPKALRLDGSVRDPNALHMAVLEQVRQRAHDFDLLHFHLDYYPFSLFSRQPTPFVITLHGRLDLPEHQVVFPRFPWSRFRTPSGGPFPASGGSAPFTMACRNGF